MKLSIACLSLTMLAAPLAAQAGRQSAADHVALGERERTALNGVNALKHYEAALSVDSMYFDALIKAADMSVEVGRFNPNEAERTALYKRAEQYARRAFRAGASGYVTKDCSREELVAAVQKVISGSKYVTAALAEKLVLDLERGTGGPPHETLSDREYEVFRLIASGKTVSEIAGILTLSDKTISTYRARILEKMGMKTNAELTHYAIQSKLVE